MKRLLTAGQRVVAGMISVFLEIKGYEFNSAPDGRQGMELAKKYHCDLAILDIMRPDPDI